MTWSAIAPILLLCVSNVFMTFAWYGQLKFPAQPLVQVLAGEISFGSHVSHIEPGSVTSAFGTSCL